MSAALLFLIIFTAYFGGYYTKKLTINKEN